ncbi:MAG: hypothetical protein ACR2NL_00530 [Acidimicrobiia bacterium]
MPSDLTTIADPQFILLAWAGGLALVSSFVSLAKVVGPGFTWVIGPVTALISLGAVFSDEAWWAKAGFLAVILGTIWARKKTVSGTLTGAGGVLLLAQASLIGGVLPAISAALALGGVTGEMILGHWYLVDPRLPRWSLRWLAYVGIGGLVADALVVSLAGLPGGGATVAYWALMITSVVLMAGVVGSLRYPAYSGVMAATGLSYLAVLTALGAVFLGRVLVAGLGPFGT